MKNSTYQPFVEQLLSLLSGPLTMVHVPFKPFPPGPALNGPVVEYTLFNPKSETGAKEELAAVTKDILDLADKHPLCHGTALGPAVEDPEQLVLLLSWPTVEVRPCLSFSTCEALAECMPGARKRLPRTSGLPAPKGTSGQSGLCCLYSPHEHHPSSLSPGDRRGQRKI
jgi:hypothetical protein